MLLYIEVSILWFVYLLQERQLKIDEYREISVPLVAWLQEHIMIMSQRNYPATLIEMKVRHSSLEPASMHKLYVIFLYKSWMVTMDGWKNNNPKTTNENIRT